jgi:hypothetical protein
VTYGKGDTVALVAAATDPRVRSGVCTRPELEALVVVAVKATEAGQVLKLRTKAHASIGWEKAKNVTLVRRGEG